MNQMIEPHDSYVGAITRIGNQVIVFFSRAYVHRSEGRAGWDPGTGWVQAAALIFSEASVTGEGWDFPDYIFRGELIVDGQKLANGIPVPFEHSGEVTLRMDFAESGEITVAGASAILTILGEAEYVEEFSGAG